MQQRLYDQYTPFANRYYRLIRQRIDMLNKRPAAAAAILARDEPSETTARTYRSWITRKKSLTYTTRPRGLMRTASFMNKVNLLNRVPRSWRDLVFPPVLPTRGS